MTVLAVGVDLVDVQRVSQMLERYGHRFPDKVLVEAEREYCLGQPDPAPHIAVRLAAKEAVYKALQASPDARRVWWKDVELARESTGQPSVKLHGAGERVAAELGVTQVLISVTHSRQQAAAFVTLLSHP